MRTHAEIIKDAKSPVVTDRLGLSSNTVNSWVRRDSIPIQHWPQFEAEGWATVDELFAHAVAKPKKAA